MKPLPHTLAATAAILLLLSVLAFWPSYFAKISTADGHTHAHAFLGTCWLLLLIAQPLLVNARAFRSHRWLGRLGVVVGVAFTVTGVIKAQHSLTLMNGEQLARFGHYVYLPLVMTLLFASALVLAVIFRRNLALHSRFMACTALPLLDPLFARILFRFLPTLPYEPLYQVPAFSLFAGALWWLMRSLPAKSRERAIFRAFAMSACGLLVLFFFTPYSESWHSVVRAFREVGLS